MMENLPIVGDDPQRRFGHTVTLINDTKAILFGGAVPTNDGTFNITNDTYMFSYENLSWRLITPDQENNKPSPRAAHGAAVVEKNQIVIFGGASGRSFG
jgi:N-acetylneuraminic acid mutarotase